MEHHFILSNVSANAICAVEDSGSERLALIAVRMRFIPESTRPGTDNSNVARLKALIILSRFDFAFSTANDATFIASLVSPADQRFFESAPAAFTKISSETSGVFKIAFLISVERVRLPERYASSAARRFAASLILPFV